MHLRFCQPVHAHPTAPAPCKLTLMSTCTQSLSGLCCSRWLKAAAASGPLQMPLSLTNITTAYAKIHMYVGGQVGGRAREAVKKGGTHGGRHGRKASSSEWRGFDGGRSQHEHTETQQLHQPTTNPELMCLTRIPAYPLIPCPVL